MVPPSAIPADDDGIRPARAADILEQRTRALAARRLVPAAADDATIRRVITCRVRTEIYGLDISAVAAVQPLGGYARLPHAQPGVLGLFGRTGRIYSIIDLGRALGLPDDDVTTGHLMVLRQDAPLVALRVSYVLGMASVPRDAFAAPIAARAGPVTAQVTLPEGIIDPAATILSLVDIDRLLRPFLSSPHPSSPRPGG